MIARFSANGERELSTLDLTSGQDDGRGGVLLLLALHASESEHREYDLGKRFRRKLAAPVVLQVRIDLAGLHALAAKAARSRLGKAKSGPLTVRGGQLARLEREELDRHGEARDACGQYVTRGGSLSLVKCARDRGHAGRCSEVA
jgi:hypothetical protein